MSNPTVLVGLAEDRRDWFPWAYAPTTPGNQKRPVIFTKDEFIEYIWRIRKLQIEVAVSSSGTDYTGSLEVEMFNAIAAPQDENEIRTAAIAVLSGAGNQTQGSAFTTPGITGFGLFLNSADYRYTAIGETFEPSIDFGTDQVTSNTGGGTPSAVTGTFLGHSVAMFDLSGIWTGSITVTALQYWSWGGNWNTTTGAAT